MTYGENAYIDLNSFDGAGDPDPNIPGSGSRYSSYSASTQRSKEERMVKSIAKILNDVDIDMAELGRCIAFRASAPVQALMFKFITWTIAGLAENADMVDYRQPNYDAVNMSVTLMSTLKKMGYKFNA
jgi:hypothetical protein